ncbi:MAG: hypothetical protein P8R37_06185 [Opitutae bacterium]|nr:hypothetical protein [Opitutae bacterium]
MNKSFPSIFNAARAGASGRTALAIASLALGCASAQAALLSEWTFDTGANSTARLASSSVASGTSISGLTMNSSGGFGFSDFGPGAVPNDEHDGFGFGGAAPGVNVMFTHRADYFDGGGTDSVNDYTSFGTAEGTTAGLGDGNAPISFTVTADAGKTVLINSLTATCAAANPGATLFVGIQEAGAAVGTTVTINGASAWTGTANLTNPIIVEAGETKTFTILLNSGALNSNHNIDSFSLDGLVVNEGEALPLGEWNFDDGATSVDRLTARSVVGGATISGLVMNTDGGGFGFRDFGPGAVPNDEHDGYGFGGNGGETVMFTSRANYFSGSAVPSPRPTTDDYTSFTTTNTAAGLGNGNAAVSFTVTADAGKTVTVESVTCHKVSGDTFILGIQRAGETLGSTVTLVGNDVTDTAVLATPITVSDGETQTFTMIFNSGALNTGHNINEFVLNGAVSDYAIPFALFSDDFNNGNTADGWVEYANGRGAYDFGTANVATISPNTGQPPSMWYPFADRVLADGETLRLSVDVMKTGTAQGTAVRFGLGYGDPLATGGGNPPVDGYQFSVASFGNDTDPQVQWMDADPTINWGNDQTTAHGSLALDNNDAYTLTDSELRTVQIDLKRSGSDYIARITVNGGQSGTQTWSSVGEIDDFKFNTIGLLAPYNNGEVFTFDNVVVQVLAAPDAFPAYADPEDLIDNGGFTQSENEVDSNPTSLAGWYTVDGSLSDWGNIGSEDHNGFWGKFADLVRWTHYNEDPNNLASEIGTVNNPTLEPDDAEFTLDGTDKLNTDFNPSLGLLNLNSAGSYRNGMIQTDILTGETINPDVNYEFSVDATATAGNDHALATFTTALTLGADVTAGTNLSNALGGTLQQISAASLPTSAGTLQTVQISGADLLAAQGSGTVNVLVQNLNTDPVPGFPDVDPSDVTGAENVSQVRIYSVSLKVAISLGDVNKDGVIDQDDVDLANLYLSGNGGDTAAARMAVLMAAPYNYTAEEALAALNLTDFDIDSDNDFDAADVTALEALLVVPDVVIESSGFNGTSFEVQVSGLVNGTTYYLMRDSDLSDGADFTTEADSVTASSDTATLSDDTPPANKAFYQITD